MGATGIPKKPNGRKSQVRLRRYLCPKLKVRPSHHLPVIADKSQVCLRKKCLKSSVLIEGMSQSLPETQLPCPESLITRNDGEAWGNALRLRVRKEQPFPFCTPVQSEMLASLRPLLRKLSAASELIPVPAHLQG